MIRVTLNLQKFKVALNTLYRILFFSKELHLIMLIACFQCHLSQNKNPNRAIDENQNPGKKEKR